jgi:hypothetical protein
MKNKLELWNSGLNDNGLPLIDILNDFLLIFNSMIQAGIVFGIFSINEKNQKISKEGQQNLEKYGT